MDALEALWQWLLSWVGFIAPWLIGSLLFLGLMWVVILAIGAPIWGAQSWMETRRLRKRGICSNCRHGRYNHPTHAELQAIQDASRQVHLEEGWYSGPCYCSYPCDKIR